MAGRVKHYIAAAGLSAAQFVAGLNPNSATAADKLKKVETPKPVAASKIASEQTSELFVPSPKSEKVTGTTVATNSPSTTTIETGSAVGEKMVMMKNGLKISRTEYIDSIIKDAVQDGLIKSQSHSDFQISDSNGHSIDDKPKYEAYIQSIKNKADQFKDPKKFSGVFNAIRDLNTDTRPQKLILTPQQIRYLIDEHPDMVQVYRKVGTLYGGLNQGIKTESLQRYAEQYVADLRKTEH